MNDLGKQKTDLLAKYAITLSAMEIGLGSLLHSLRIPFRGNLLSLHQGFWLCRLQSETKNLPFRLGIPAQLSAIVAVLKSWSPAGEKIGPMLSLSAQGVLFSFGLFVAGAGFMGQILAMILLSIWPLIQPFLTYYIFLGDSFPLALEYFWKKNLNPEWQHKAVMIFYTIVAVKIILSIAVVFLAKYLTKKSIDSWEQYLLNNVSKAKRPQMTLWRGLWRDFTRPLFILSFSITILFLYFSEIKKNEIFFIIIRSLALAFVFFYISRSTWFKNFILKKATEKQSTFYRSISMTLEKIIL